jgi:hypothetical protein
MENKECSTCGIVKHTENFTVDNGKKDKLSSRCKECKNKRQTELYRLNDYLHNPKYVETRRRGERSRSLKLKILREERQKVKDEQKKEKELRIQEKKIKRQQLLDEKLKRQEYLNSEEHKLEMLKRAEERKIKEKVRVREKNRRKSKVDPAYRIRRIQKSRIYRICKEKNFIKTKNFDEIFGLNTNDFRKYFEVLFYGGITWDNYSEKVWEVDHIIPIRDIQTFDDLVRIFHHTNHQPLLMEDHRNKSNNMLTNPPTFN